MNYYEELGIRSDADEEEIRKAHRRLVKLMHPDQHRDQGLKQLAETQMRRLNSIVATLLDPEERREYDEQLRGGGSHDSPNSMPHQSAWRSVPWWIASTLGAVILTVGAIWFFADRLNSGFSTRTPTQISEEGTGTAKPTVSAPADDIKSGSTPPAAVTLPPAQSVPPAQATASTDNAHPSLGTTPAPNNDSNENVTVAKVQMPKAEVPPKTEVHNPAQPPVFPPVPTSPPVKTATKVAPPPVSVPVVAKNTHDAAAKTAAALKTAPEAAKSTSKTTIARSIPPPPLSTAAPSAVKPAAPPPASKHLAYVPAVSVTPKSTTTLAELGPAPATGYGVPVTNGDVYQPRSGDIPPPAFRSRDPLEGEWVYAPSEPEKSKPGLYPPEFIQLKLRKDGGGMHGEYNARYNITDNRPQVSPEVNFSLKSVDDKSMKYVWTASDGRRGTFTILALEADTMRLQWKTTSSRGVTALSSGEATLVRKN